MQDGNKELKSELKRQLQTFQLLPLASSSPIPALIAPCRSCFLCSPRCFSQLCLSLTNEPLPRFPPGFFFCKCHGPTVSTRSQRRLRACSSLTSSNPRVVISLLSSAELETCSVKHRVHSTSSDCHRSFLLSSGAAVLLVSKTNSGRAEGGLKLTEWREEGKKLSHRLLMLAILNVNETQWIEPHASDFSLPSSCCLKRPSKLARRLNKIILFCTVSLKLTFPTKFVAWKEESL